MPSNPVKLIALLVALTACTPFDDPLPGPWDARLYTGDSSRGGMYNGKGDDLIKPGDERFNGLVCLGAEDFRKLIGSYRYLKSNTCELPPK